jgi:AGZA family xanthine/uracil permease-like MFS transporter
VCGTSRTPVDAGTLAASTIAPPCHNPTLPIQPPTSPLNPTAFRYFRVSERGSTIATEIKSGVVTFLTMSYILLVNPQILGAAGVC